MQQDNASSANNHSLITFFKPASILAALNIVCLFGFGGMMWGIETNRTEEIKLRVDELKEQLVSVNIRLDANEKALNDERFLATNRLAVVENDIKYISQTLQELKIILQPKR